MKLKTFIDRPILSCAISVLILILGVIGLSNLPMEQYPDIAPPTIMVSTTYTGANAETVLKSVIAPLEEAINGVENMTYMTSTATNTGSASITVYFAQGTDPDMATVNTKNRVSEAEGLLPAEVTKVGVTVEKRQNSMVKIISLYSPDDSYDQNFINNYFKINVEPRLSRISGVGNVNVMGGDYAMRIWMNPQKMAQYQLVPADVIALLDDQNVEAATGTLGEDSENTFRVMIQARKDYRLDKESLNNMFVRTESGEMAPVGQFITLTKVYGVETLTRFNMYTSIPVNGMPADGYSSGDAIAAIEEVASQTLPTGYGYEFSGITREESSSTGNTVIIFIICIVFIYLILCSLYESIFIPMVVILAVPFGLMGSFLFAKCFGLENNIYMQTGLIMLIGLLSKTAILLTEYASARRRQGMSIAQAAVAAAGVRLRPILMTALTMIIGLFPLIVATGAGANGNRSLGVGTVGGMLVGTVALLFVVPVLFTVFQAIEERVMPRRQTDAAE